MKSILTLIVAVIMASSMFAQAPNKMSYQAVIRNSSNALIVTKTVGIKISILQTTSSGAVVFAETHTPQTNANGLATLEIGSGTVVSGSFAGIDWSKGPYFIKTETDPTGGTNYTISGVSQMLSVPYSLQSATANALSTSATGVVRSLNGKGGSLFLKGAGGTTINNSGDTISISSSGGSGGTGIQGVQSTDGIVRISNPNGPIATLNINDGSIPAEKLAAGVIPTSLPTSGAAGGDLSGTFPNPLVVKLQGRPITNTLPTTGQSLAWNGTAWAPSSVSSGWSLTGNTGINPLANFLGTKDSTPLIFKAFNSERMRITESGNIGIGTNAPLSSLHVNGYTTLSNAQDSSQGNTGIGQLPYTNVKLTVKSNQAFGVYIDAPSTPNGNALYVNGSTTLSPDSSKGNLGVGRFPPSNSKLTVKSNQDYGVYIDAPTTPNGNALYVLGSAAVTGTLSKGGGSFKIDHPLDPANKYLYHSFVESPDMMNIYNGNITTDDLGIATVGLPDYFEALNKDFRYQLTVIGTFAQAIILQKVKGNSFVIKTDKPNVEVSWQVTGIRQDAFANKNRIPNSVEKVGKERGLYLHPDAFGLPESSNMKNIQLEAPVK